MYPIYRKWLKKLWSKNQAKHHPSLIVSTHILTDYNRKKGVDTQQQFDWSQHSPLEEIRHMTDIIKKILREENMFHSVLWRGSNVP